MFCFNVFKNEWNYEYAFAGRWKIYASNAFKTAWFYLYGCGSFTKNKERIEKFM